MTVCNAYIFTLYQTNVRLAITIKIYIIKCCAYPSTPTTPPIPLT